MSARVCFVVGARPNFMKSAPVYRELAALDPSLELLLLHTGQHYDDAMSDVFFRELGMPRPDEFLAVGSGTHAEQTAKVLVGVERVLLEREIDLCVVAGDVNSTIAAALAAVKLGIPIAHIEAGLRSFDRAMPEEHNRVLTDHLSDILLAHSEEAITNLQREGITSGVHLVGNTMIDTLLEHLDKARERQSWEQFGLHAGRVRPRHAPPPRARRRPREADRGHRRADHARPRPPRPLPGAPADAAQPGVDRRRRAPARLRRARDRAAGLSRLPLPRGRRRLRPHRLGRRSRRRRRHSASAASRSATRPSGASRRSSARTPFSARSRSGSPRSRSCSSGRSPAR